MARNLRDRANAQLALHETSATTISQALLDARDSLSMKHPAPDNVPQDQWAAQFGGSQHVEVSRAALAALGAEEEQIRAQIAGVANPADAQTFEDQLRDVLVRQAALRVEHRYARERAARADALIEGLARIAAAAAQGVDGARGRADDGSTRQSDVEALTAALNAAPLSTIVADAAAVVGGAALTGARDRLEALIPDDLRNRARARYDESDAVLTDAADLADDARAQLTAVDLGLSPIAGEVATTGAAFSAAVGALRTYVTSAPTDLDDASTTLPRVTATADLTAAQVAALDPAAQPDAVTAASNESDLAAAVAGVAAAQRAVDDAVLAALFTDPDADPNADAAVIAARTALTDPTVQDPLTNARAAYDAASRAALDAWEVEVPPALWAALADLLDAEHTLTRLADQAQRDALVDTVDQAQDSFADALDAADVEARRRWAVSMVAVTREAALTEANATASDRGGAYLRGDGPAGRTPMEL